MKRFQFTLESVRRLRQFRKDEAVRELRNARIRRFDSEKRLSAAEDSLDRYRRELTAGYNPSSPAGLILLRQNALAQFEKDLEILKVDCIKARSYEEQCLEKVIQTRKAEASMDLLRSKRQEVHRLEAEKEDEAVALEFFNAISKTREGQP